MKKLGKFKGTLTVRKNGNKAVLLLKESGKHVAVKMYRGCLFDAKGNMVKSASELKGVTLKTAVSHLSKM